MSNSMTSEEMRAWSNIITVLEPIKDMSVDELNRLYSDIKKTEEYQKQHKTLLDTLFNVAINENDLINSDEFNRFAKYIQESYTSRQPII